MNNLDNINALSTVDDCALHAERVDIWQFSLQHLPSWANGLLNPEEQQRAKRYHFSKHQRRFTTARATLRIILSKYLKQIPQNLSFAHNKHGKPSLVNNTEKLHFNLSHSQENALLAVGKENELGIDLEYFSKRSYLGIADHVFSAAEIHALTQLPEESQALSFFTIWAQKEAFIKAVGMGLAYPLKQLTVPALPGTDYEIIDSLTQKTWRLISLMPKAACSAALCIHPSVTEIRQIELTNLEGFYYP